MNNKQLVVIKLGGSSLQDPSTLQEVIESIRGYRRYGYRVAVVHGGGPAINEELTRRGITWKFINGQRQTTLEMISVIEEVLAGKINSQLVTSLQAAGINAVGLSGATDQTLLCRQSNPELGQVGTIINVSTSAIESLLNLETKENAVPVIAPIGIGINGEKYNINADWAAAKIATALNAEKLIFLTDQKGILNHTGELIPEVNSNFLSELVEKEIVTGGMYTKVLTVLEALKNGVPQVRVMNGKDAGLGLWSDVIGTMAHV